VLEAPRSLRLRRSICVQLKIFLILSPGVDTVKTADYGYIWHYGCMTTAVTMDYDDMTTDAAIMSLRN